MKTRKRIDPQTRSFRLSKAAYERAHDACEGRCLACGTARYDCEPDAREYPCDACGAALVYGIEELLIMGRIVITRGTDV